MDHVGLSPKQAVTSQGLSQSVSQRSGVISTAAFPPTSPPHTHRLGKRRGFAAFYCTSGSCSVRPGTERPFAAVILAGRTRDSHPTRFPPMFFSLVTSLDIPHNDCRRATQNVTVEVRIFFSSPFPPLTATVNICGEITGILYITEEGAKVAVSHHRQFTGDKA